MFRFDRNANKRPGVVELPGETRHVRLRFRRHREGAAPDDLVQIRIGDVACGPHGLVRSRKCKGREQACDETSKQKRSLHVSFSFAQSIGQSNDPRV